MVIAFRTISMNLRLWAVMSSFWLLLGAGFAHSHEVVPAIADLTVTDGRVVIEMRVNLEAQMSGIDLDSIADTNNAENPEDYDVLRALEREDIARRTAALVATWSAVPMLTAAGAPLDLRLDGVDVPEVPDEELPRISQVVMSGALPSGASSLQVAWPAGSGDLVLRQQGVDEAYTGLISGGGNSGPIAIAGGDEATGWQTFFSYVPVGFDHILPKGLDHILFVLGLFFLSVRLSPLLWQISAFTLAHTVTLALGALGLVTVPASVVEPLIAASIVYVAIENVFMSGLSRWRPFVVFGFGLLHGLGFASVLGEFGLPAGQFLPALVAFNIGVELGQLTVIALAFLVVGLFASKPWYRQYISIPASLAIAAVGAYWVVERVFL
jgi:HupE/UreJ protein